jgi:hypothetical protein
MVVLIFLCPISFIKTLMLAPLELRLVAKVLRPL